MIGAIVLLSALSLNAAPAEPAKDPLQPLQFLVGHCWAGDFPNNMGKDTHCFEPMYGGRFIRDKHVLHGKGPDYLGESIYAFDPKQKRIVFWYWSSDGDIEHGIANPSAEGLEFPEHHLTEPQDLTFRTHWRRLDANRYEAVNERKDGEAWKTEWKIEYRRVPKGK